MRSHGASLSPALSRCGRRAVWVVALLISALGLRAATFLPLLTNGPASNRLTLVFLAEGYTAAETNIFRTDCTNALNALFGGGSFTGEEPFVEYGSYFNACGIFTNSTASGVDHPLFGISRSTYFNCAYDGIYDYVITNDAIGQSRVDTLLNTFLPTNQHGYRLPILLVNDASLQTGESGGSGGATVIVGQGGNFQGTLVHEMAHSLAGLGDEYETGPNGFDYTNLPSEPNTTTNTTFAAIPWKAWINTNTTPIPTPNDSQYYYDVGLFEGAHYSPTNWYRPRLNCRMRSVSTGVPFCEVCREALVRSFYSRIRAADALSPTNALVPLTPGQSQNFTITPLQPLTHNLSRQWQTNGIPVPGATNTSFQVTAQAGIATVSVIVRDPTDWVRYDPAGLLNLTNTWNLSVLWLESPQALAGGKFRLTVRGTGVTNFTLKASTNLVSWTSLTTNALVGGQYQFTNSATNLPWHYYRAVSPPQ